MEAVDTGHRFSGNDSEDDGFSVSNLARSLGLALPNNSSTGSSSSEFSQSEGSSLSSAPSEDSWSRRKLPMRAVLDTNVKMLPSQLSPEAVYESPKALAPPPVAISSPTMIKPSLSSSEGGRRPSERALHQPPRSATAPPGRSRPKGHCKGCGEVILGKSVSSADGRLTGRYHRACFVCYECQAPFLTSDFYVHDDRPYCAYHYHKLNYSLCSSCDQGIEGQYLETVERTGRGPGDRQKFHPYCLRCCTCHVSLRGDYYEWYGRVYCEQDIRWAVSGVPYAPMTSSPLVGYSDPAEPSNDDAAPRGLERTPEKRTTRLMVI